MSDDKDKDGTPPPNDQRTVFIPKDGPAGTETPATPSPPDASPPDSGDPGPDVPTDDDHAWAQDGEGEPTTGPEDPWGPAESGDGDGDGAGQVEDPWGSASESHEPPPEHGGPDPRGEDRTRFEASPRAPTQPPSPPATSLPPTGAVSPRDNAQGIRVGDVLNHIFEVKRFIARGGMGEVFEGCNVNSDEKVAIKVMLPSLAADPNVINMFRREARTLTRLQHEALVQYRVLAQEPQLGVLYIVTEYIDGVSLSDVLGKLAPEPAELEALLRRLASGLRAAHALGVLHRDMSPDNVLLEDGRLSGAKIIDFGIAKDLDPSSATIIGDGFAGKLSYVAPEQLGDFGREMGTWTDVYSLGLVILAVAMGRDVQMGGTLVDAVDKRRAGIDLAPIPERLRPVLEQMLRPNPAERLRTMDEVLAALDAATGGASTTGEEDRGGGGAAGLPKPALIGGAAVLAVLVAGGIWLAAGSSEDPAAPGQGTAVSAASNPVQAARQAIDAVIPSVGCSWLDVESVSHEGGQVSVSMGGVAGSPSAAQSEIASALTAAGLPNANLDFSLVATISTAGCAAIDAYRQIRNTEAPRLSAEQRVWEMRKQPPGAIYEGKEAANVVSRMNIGDPNLDLTLFGIDPAGILYPMLERVGGRQVVFFEGEPPVPGWEVEGSPITAHGNDSYTINIDLDHEGWQGLVLVTGRGPFPTEVVQPPLGSRNTAWQRSFAQTAGRQGWKTEMTWFKSVNQRPGD